jgi:hypothetical protein
MIAIHSYPMCSDPHEAPVLGTPDVCSCTDMLLKSQIVLNLQEEGTAGR